MEIEKIENNIKLSISKSRVIVNEDPIVYTINNFISDQDCQHMIKIASHKVDQALVSGDKQGFVSKGRSGKNCWIHHNFDDITQRIGNSISQLVDIPLENAEAFQVIYYDKDQEYRQHYDGWLFDGSEKSRRNMKYGGQRMVTALVYLNTVPKGGGTRFTKLEKEVNAEKGKILVFNNVHKGTTERHNMSEHAGMPVIEGEKWAFNLWFREKSRKVLYEYPIGEAKDSLTSSTDICSIKTLSDNKVQFKINYDNLLYEETKQETKQYTNCQYKNTMNDEWREWVKRQLNKNICLNTIEGSLKKQNYSQNIIDSVLYNKIDQTRENIVFSTIDITDTEDKNQDKNQDKNLDKNQDKINNIIEYKPNIELVDQFPNTFLEIGDYFPFIKIGSKEMHNLTDSKYILLVCVDDVSIINFNIITTLRKQYHVFVIYNNNSLCKSTDNLSMENSNIYNILKIPEENINIYILNANRRIVDIKNIEKLADMNLIQLDKYTINTNNNIPYLVVDNVLNPELLKEILVFYDDNNNRRELHNSITKNRIHVHPDIELEKKIDNKLSRSLFLEVRKIFYFNIKYRELYKICSYDAETSGRFHAHRDTPYPYQHRKFALSLLLNDDYEGGELFLPEYNVKIKPKANTAIVFPGICTHQVLQVTKGSRKTIITFFCSEIEGKTINNSLYMVKSDFFSERNIQSSQIYPF